MAATSARVQVINEVVSNEDLKGKEWVLCLQWCRYIYDDATIEMGFRFIWRRPDGSLQAARGQARIPSLEEASLLMEKAKNEGWGYNSNTKEKIENK